MTTTTAKPSAKFKSILSGYRKKEIVLSPLPAGQVESQQNTSSYWDSGSRDQYIVLNLNTGNSFVPPTGSYNQGFRDNGYTLKPGEILINHGDSCGKPMRARIIYFPEDLELVKSFYEGEITVKTW